MALGHRTSFWDFLESANALIMKIKAFFELHHVTRASRKDQSIWHPLILYITSYVLRIGE